MLTILLEDKPLLHEIVVRPLPYRGGRFAHVTHKLTPGDPEYRAPGVSIFVIDFSALLLSLRFLRLTPQLLFAERFSEATEKGREASKTAL